MADPPMTTPPEPTVDLERIKQGVSRIEGKAAENPIVKDLSALVFECARLTTDNQHLRDRLALADSREADLRNKIGEAVTMNTDLAERLALAERNIRRGNREIERLYDLNLDLKSRLALAEQALAHPAYAWVRDALADGRIITKLIPPQDCLHGIRYAGFYCQDYDGPGLDETTPP